MLQHSAGERCPSGWCGILWDQIRCVTLQQTSVDVVRICICDAFCQLFERACLPRVGDLTLQLLCGLNKPKEREFFSGVLTCTDILLSTQIFLFLLPKKIKIIKNMKTW